MSVIRSGMVNAAHHRFSFAEYAELIEDSGVKMEFLDGQVWAMSGGSPDHARVTANVTASLTTALKGKPCAVYSPDLRVRSKATGLGTYADVTVICGPIELDPDDPKRHTALNPRVVVDVLSPSTEEYDRGAKLDHYKTIPSLREVVFVAFDKHEIEVVRREAKGSWSTHVVGDTAKLLSLDLGLSLDDVYYDPLR